MAVGATGRWGTLTAEPPIHPKAKHENIRVAPAVLDAARKDGEELLESLRTTAAGLTQAEAEERARTRVRMRSRKSGGKAGSSAC